MRKIGAIMAMVVLLAPLVLPRVSAQQEINVFYQMTPGEDAIFRKILQQTGKDLNIKVKPINMDTIDTMNKVSAEVRAGGKGSVNVIFTDVTYVGMWYKSGTYLDLTSRFNDWKDKPDIFELILDAGIIEDKIVALPLRTDCEVLYYNEEMFNKYSVPTPDTWESWDDFYSAAKTFKEKTGTPRFGMKGNLYEGLTCDFLSYVWAAGGRVADPQGNVYFNSPETIEALNFLRKLRDEGLIHRNSRIWKEGSIVEEGMIGNQIYMAMDWPYAMSMLQGAGRTQWKVALTPPGPKTRATALGGWYFVIPGNAPNLDVTWEFVKHMMDDKMQLLMNEKLGWAMANKNAWQIDESWPQWQKDLVNAQREMLNKYAMPRPKIARWTEVSHAIQMCFDRIIYRGEDVAQIVERTAREIQKIIEEG